MAKVDMLGVQKSLIKIRREGGDKTGPLGLPVSDLLREGKPRL